VVECEVSYKIAVRLKAVSTCEEVGSTLTTCKIQKDRNLTRTQLELRADRVSILKRINSKTQYCGGKVMNHDHCCGQCLTNCGTQFKTILPSGRVIYFCTCNCQNSFEQKCSKEIQSRKNGGK